MASKRRTKITTTSDEIYQKLNRLQITSNVMLEGVKPSQVRRIIKGINGNGNILSMEKIGKYVMVRKHGPLNINVYKRKK